MCTIFKILLLILPRGARGAHQKLEIQFEIPGYTFAYKFDLESKDCVLCSMALMKNTCIIPRIT